MYTRLKIPTLITGFGALAALALGTVLINTPAASADAIYGVDVPAPTAHLHNVKASETAQTVFAGGCFWGMEMVFSHVKGVTDVVSGYAGGDKAHANYRDSSSGRYGDAEAVRISYDPSRISYAELLRIYFSTAHDPTEVNRQGPDVGSQYRSEIFAADADQARVARAYIAQLNQADVFNQAIATRVSVGKSFFKAERYHQNYGQRHPNSFYIRYNDVPKVNALKKRFPERYSAAFVGSNQPAGK